MISLSQNPPTPDSIRLVKAEQDTINQMQSELLTSFRVSPDEAIESWQKLPLRIGDWSSRLESEICHFLG